MLIISTRLVLPRHKLLQRQKTQRNWDSFYLRLVRRLNTTTSKLRYKLTQPAITCSKLTIETLEQGVKYVQS